MENCQKCISAQSFFKEDYVISFEDYVLLEKTCEELSFLYLEMEDGLQNFLDKILNPNDVKGFYDKAQELQEGIFNNLKTVYTLLGYKVEEEEEDVSDNQIVDVEVPFLSLSEDMPELINAQ